MSRRYGGVQKSRATTLNEMLSLHSEEAFDWIADRAGLGADSQQDEARLETGGVMVAEDLVMSLEKPQEQNGIA